MSESVETAEERKPAYREVELDLEVVGHERIADGVVGVSLAQPDGDELPSWTAGAHVDLLLTSSLVRQYSLCGSPKDLTTWKVAVLRDPDSRGGSEFVHEKLQTGSTIRVRGPRNHFPLITSERYQFIAGGIGITPLLPMIEAAETLGAEWNLLYGGRSLATMAFVDELAAFGDKVSIRPQDEQGALDLGSVLGTPRDDTLVYCCGPERLLGAVEEHCSSWSAGSLQLERFAAKAVTEEQAAGALDTFEVVCARSGIAVTVTGDDSIYECLEEAGIDVLGACLSGVCGTCETSVLEGTPDHRDSILTDAEKEEGSAIMICVSRSRSERLVLDL